MQVNVEQLDYCEVLVNYQADSDEIENKKNLVLDTFKNAPVKGYRKGKADKEAIKLFYKKQVDEALKRALSEDALHNTLFEKNLRPLGAPEFKSVFFSGDQFNCTFKLKVQPDFELQPYKDLEIPKPKVESVNDAAESIMQKLRVQHGTQVPYVEGDFVQMNDIVIVNYKAFDNGVEVEQLNAAGEMLNVGHSMLPGFDDNLFGLKVGEKREFLLTVPSDGLPSLAGKLLKFEVELVAGSKMEPAPLDDSLAQKLGKESFEVLRELVLKAGNTKVENEFKEKLVSQVSKQLVAANIFRVPDWLTLPEAQNIARNAKLNWDNVPDIDKAKLLEMATENIKLSIILDRIRDEEPEAQLSDTEVVDMVKSIVSKTEPGKDPTQVMQELSQSGYLQSLFVRIRDEHVLGFLVEKAKIID